MTQLVFVYGSLLSGLGNHGILTHAGAQLLGPAETAPRFTMISLGQFPGAVPVGEDAIVGELYRVSDNALEALDALEGHPMFYRRQLHEVVSADDSQVRAWIYLLDRSYLKNYDAIAPDWRAHVAERERECEACGDEATTELNGYNLCEACAAILREMC